MKLVRLLSGSLSALAVLSSSGAQAVLRTDIARGESQVSIPVAGRGSEICVIPTHLEMGDYSAGDLKKETALCALDEAVNSAVCAKTNSTNPGLNFYSLPDGMTPAQLQAKNCEVKGKDGKSLAKKVAKYKLSTSCSYAPSILAYYHVSRILGGAGHVPVAVLRTFDVQNHIAVGKKALAATKQGDVIHATWAGLVSQLSAGPAASRRDTLLTSDFKQSYGALSVNPSKDLFYKEFFNGGADNVSRTTNLRDKNPIISALSKQADIDSIVGTSFTAANVQLMTQLKDASDMIVLDTLLSQQDRMGNIHYEAKYFSLDRKQLDQNGLPQIVENKELTPDQAKAQGAVLVKRMLLKDNDCGVAKDNIDKKVNLASKIAHMDPATYAGLLNLNEGADSDAIKKAFLTGMNFTSQDYALFRQNLKDLSGKMHAACQAGTLRLDLNLPAHFSGQKLEAPGCDLQ